MDELTHEFQKSRPQITNHNVIFHVSNLASLLRNRKSAASFHHNSTADLAQEFEKLSGLFRDMLAYSNATDPVVAERFDMMARALENISETLLDSWDQKSGTVEINHLTLETMMMHRRALEDTNRELHALGIQYKYIDDRMPELPNSKSWVLSYEDLLDSAYLVKQFDQKLSALETFLESRDHLALRPDRTPESLIRPVSS